MCGRFYLTTDAQTLREHFEASGSLDLTPRYNIAPSQEVPAVRQGEAGRELIMLRWGLIPSWAKTKKIGHKMINARAETVASKPAFRVAFRRRRILVPGSGFFEWKKIEGGKQPYSIRTNNDLFALAGLWEHWQGEGGESIESCTIIVTEANEKIRSIHDAGDIGPRRLCDLARSRDSGPGDPETLITILPGGTDDLLSGEPHGQ